MGIQQHSFEAQLSKEGLGILLCSSCALTRAACFAFVWVLLALAQVLLNTHQGLPIMQPVRGGTAIKRPGPCLT